MDVIDLPVVGRKYIWYKSNETTKEDYIEF